MSNPPPNPPNDFPLSVQRGIHNDGVITESEAKDLENDMWNICLGEVKEDDQRIADAWKGGADSILVFTGLFSATVGAFIIEFYKKLSPDSAGQTVDLLGQISQQLANISDGIHTNAAIPSQPSPLSAAIVWVNAMWLISLVLSITSALIATLLQQWARRYIDTPKDLSDPNHRAHVRWFLKLGNDVYKTGLLVEVAANLIHISVYLFFAGLVIVFHTINENVAIAVDATVGVIVLAYFMLSILPCLDVKCPYRTPMTYTLWNPCHIFFFFAARCLGWLVEGLHEASPDAIIESTWQLKLVNWSNSCGKAMMKHCEYLADGFGKSVIKVAVDAREWDRKIITSLFSALSLRDKSKLRKVAAGIPRHRIFDLLRPVESGRFGLRDPLLALLRSCTEGTYATGPDEDVRKRALVICLDAIQDVSKTTPQIPELNFVRVNFANIGLMRTLWDDRDTAIRVTSRSICALVAKRLGRGMLEEGELRWLQDVIGEPSHEIYNAGVEARDRMNFKSFVYGVLSDQVDELPPEDATSFRETLAILLDVGDDPHFNYTFSQDKLSQNVTRIHEDDPQGSREVVNTLLSMFPFIPPPSPVPVI